MEVKVVKIPHSEKINILQLYLKDELLKVWGRKVNITYITESKFLGYISVEELLCSRTLAGSDT